MVDIAPPPPLRQGKNVKTPPLFYGVQPQTTQPGWEKCVTLFKLLCTFILIPDGEFSRFFIINILKSSRIRCQGSPGVSESSKICCKDSPGLFEKSRDLLKISGEQSPWYVSKNPYIKNLSLQKKLSSKNIKWTTKLHQNVNESDDNVTSRNSQARTAPSQQKRTTRMQN